MKYTAFVPARSGSKRLPNKNIRLLAGKPLVVWTLEAFINSDKVEEVIFSTDSIEYWEIVQNYIHSEKLLLDLRTAKSAGDKVKIFDYLKHQCTKIFGNRKNMFILALPTAPLRQTHHITEAIKLHEETNKPIFSATSFSFPVSFAFVKNDLSWQAIFDDNPMNTGNTRSQDQIESFHPNGALYIRSINDLYLENLESLYTDAVPYIMSNLDSIDVDNEVDFTIAEAIIKHNESLN